MKHIWSPWRMEYIKEFLKEEGCVFCDALNHSDGIENLIVIRGERAFVILNRFPYTSGHLMILPYNHVSTLEELDCETRNEMFELTNQSCRVLREEYAPQGLNVGMNIGEAAGAGITEHLHLHVVPRWMGDTNFMSSLGETRVVPEALDETYRRIKAGWEKNIKE